jgi:hypothetical protein
MEYRAYFIGEDGHFIRAVELVCSDESTARSEAKRLVDGTISSFGRATEK